MEVVLKMLFLLLSNADIQFDIEKLIWKTYTAIKTLSTTSWVEVADKEEFAKVVLDINLETFIVYILVLKAI